MEYIAHIETVHTENEFVDQNQMLWFCPCHLYSESVMLNPLNTHCGEHLVALWMQIGMVWEISLTVTAES